MAALRQIKINNSVYDIHSLKLVNSTGSALSVGNANTPVYFSNGIPVQCNISNITYTLTKSGNTITLKGSDGSSTSVTDSDTNTKVTQTVTTTNASYPLLFKNSNATTTITDSTRFSTEITCNPNTSTISAKIFDATVGFTRIDITGKTLDLNTLTLSSGQPEMLRYVEKTNGGASNITCGDSDIPVSGQPFILDVDSIRWVSASDYITRQVFSSIGDTTHDYVRWCNNGVWKDWVKRIYTDTNTTYSQATSSRLGLVKIGYTESGKNYPVELDSNGKMFVNVPWTDTNTDTKNTTGSTNTSSKIYLIGATTQTSSAQTYSHDTAYVGTDGHLYSNSSQVVNLSSTQTITGQKTFSGKIYVPDVSV